jgi:hypothetical protein
VTRMVCAQLFSTSPLLALAPPCTCPHPHTPTRSAHASRLTPASCTDMDSLGQSLIALFQIGTTNNWNSIMYPNIYK